MGHMLNNDIIWIKISRYHFGQSRLQITKGRISEGIAIVYTHMYIQRKNLLLPHIIADFRVKPQGGCDA